MLFLPIGKKSGPCGHLLFHDVADEADHSVMHSGLTIRGREPSGSPDARPPNESSMAFDESTKRLSRFVSVTGPRGFDTERG